MKKLIIKSAFKILGIILLITLLSSLTQSTLITNELALGQMYANNEGFIIWIIFNKIKPIINLVLSGFCGYLIYGVAFDIYKFFKNKIEIENEKEI